MPPTLVGIGLVGKATPCPPPPPPSVVGKSRNFFPVFCYQWCITLMMRTMSAIAARIMSSMFVGDMVKTIMYRRIKGDVVLSWSRVVLPPFVYHRELASLVGNQAVYFYMLTTVSYTQIFPFGLLPLLAGLFISCL